MKLLNYLSAFIGFLLLLGGVLKLTDSMPVMSLGNNIVSINLPTYNNLLYISIVNFIGGGAMLFHALFTLKFKNVIVLPKGNFDVTADYPNLEKFSSGGPLIISGLITIGISFWHILYASFILFSFGDQVFNFIGLFVFSIFIFGLHSIIPIILASSNISLQNKISGIKTKQDLIKRVNNN